MKREEIAEIAREYIDRKHPSWPPVDNKELVIEEHNGVWEIRWEVSPGQFGGGPVIRIDQKTRQIVEAFHTQ